MFKNKRRDDFKVDKVEITVYDKEGNKEVLEPSRAMIALNISDNDNFYDNRITMLGDMNVEELITGRYMLNLALDEEIKNMAAKDIPFPHELEDVPTPDKLKKALEDMHRVLGL